ncbi:MAG: T9SS type A sorting domain-containing protein [Bacteroidetes bacterium]|nr:T9SS type A sorting domain-containing protein [Bacteroidota bacterium]
MNMYLAANGKIYVTSGSGVQHIHEINYPDSAGIACDVQQHAIDLGYAQLRSVPNHPNYYLGCDTTLGCPCLITGIEELGGHEFRFIVAPNPTSGNFKITYLLPQNQPGKLEVFDINGRRIYEMNLPHWSTMQEVSLPKSISSGVYNCVITSGGERGNKKVVVYRE